ncbi:phytoene/squalene synthase family protein [Breoghania sp. L-A4]|uniref:phytoene/squalene synthase family protein n=1 Tax=Breoghania sp. L-A4 TaxID=2304600 RepID=UPI000E360B73|nr:phytoene/squalene synthase family protein [Breoghania sp. L-A4]AXS42570.1 squalene/phytoene synthase family protein [Breoghania sp. L-A4]
MQSSFDHCQDLVRRHDKDRYLATLFVPAGARPHVFALYAFNLEVARVRELVSDALPGEIRLQWWRDTLTGNASGQPETAAHPVAAALLETIARYDLPEKPFLDLLEARIFDLYDDPMPSLSDLEGYAGETTSVLFQLVSMILAENGEGAPADAAGHGGVAYALTGLLRALPWHARRGQTYLPADLLSACGVDMESYRQLDATPHLRACLGELRLIIAGHLEKARAALGACDPACAPAFLPLALIEPYLAAMERPGVDPFNTPIELAQWRRQWTLWRASRRGI